MSPLLFEIQSGLIKSKIKITIKRAQARRWVASKAVTTSDFVTALHVLLQPAPVWSAATQSDEVAALDSDRSSQPGKREIRLTLGPAKNST